MLGTRETIQDIDCHDDRERSDGVRRDSLPLLHQGHQLVTAAVPGLFCTWKHQQRLLCKTCPAWQGAAGSPAAHQPLQDPSGARVGQLTGRITTRRSSRQQVGTSPKKVPVLMRAVVDML